ncbi:MAG TPA: type I DNA topoisomerase [Patescibacteria group bacterium]|jgi:DNA topoisomerase-1|nr:type I DNA topoisomerase [Patescibacteria group bacterium]
MSKNLVIVESPAKAKTIAKFLGDDFVVKSSFGHIRDLPKKGMSVDIANNFAPNYEVSSDKKKIVSELRKAAKEATTVWLASDQDREGEAIAWHLSEVLKLKPQNTKRIVFHEITKPAIQAAIEHPGEINISLVDAQQARRILDRIVGYELSPVLWKKVRTGLSAGRVQSVTVRLIVEREREIEAFDAQATFKLSAVFKLADGTKLPAECPTRFENESDAHKLLESLATSDCVITDTKKTPGTRSPSAPFTTSTLQQEASRRLGYSPKQTMMLAQRLYEEGHITYMRTDSVNLSSLAIQDMTNFIKNTYGNDYHHSRTFTTKSAGAQEAHEAIRPTNITKREAGNDAQQQKLYDLIWRRSLCTQMSSAKVEKTVITVGLSKAKETFEAKGEVITFPGFLKVQNEGKKTNEDGLLPDVKKGDTLQLEEASAEQIFSRPPARYTEATLVRKLEELGIGRPSTYAPTISTVQNRGYVEKADVEGGEREIIRLKLDAKTTDIRREQSSETPPADKNKLVPTSTGQLVTDFLAKYFNDIVDYDFTKYVEQEFDLVATDKLSWQKMLAEFYVPFHQKVEGAADISRAEASQSRPLGDDPKTGKPISARFGRFGPMVQIGTAEDEEKPRFASIPASKKLETITLAEALELFNLPRTLGVDSAGNNIEANIGRFGPYVKIGSSYVSIRGHDPYTIDLDTAKELIAEDTKKKSEREIKIFDSEGIKILKGRFGPYITDGNKNVKIPKDKEPQDLTIDECRDLLEKAPAKRRVTRKRSVKK